MITEIKKEELATVIGGRASASMCKWLFTTCMTYPHGCTNPCALYTSQCTR